MEAGCGVTSKIRAEVTPTVPPVSLVGKKIVRLPITAVKTILCHSGLRCGNLLLQCLSFKVIEHLNYVIRVNPLEMDISLIRTVSVVLLVSVLAGFY